MSCVTTLEQKGLRLTPQRRLILDIIHESGRHITAEEILNYVQARAPGVNKSTVYRTLELLKELGCVFRSELGGKSIYHHAEEGHHHHFICHICGRIVDCDEELFLSVEKLANVKYGFQPHFKHMVISGICNDCREKR